MHSLPTMDSKYLRVMSGLGSSGYSGVFVDDDYDMHSHDENGKHHDYRISNLLSNVLPFAKRLLAEANILCVITKGVVESSPNISLWLKQHSNGHSNGVVCKPLMHYQLPAEL